MSAISLSFIDLFEQEISYDNQKVRIQKIVVPAIQRDYAQGRQSTDVNRVRERFLSSLYEAVLNKPIELDFVYGNIDTNGIFTPLDGQQRLTTLFLLHWYVAKKEGVSEEEYAFLKKFSYETRYSTRTFCEKLIAFTPSLKGNISDEIKDKGWFPLGWKKDPTIKGMLVMLDAIHEKFKNIPDVWSKLKNKSITFYVLFLQEMGLTDELYIKMNSRGKPLTTFEHLKAELERELRLLDEKQNNTGGDILSKRIIGKIDRQWTDLLWQYRNSSTGSDANNSKNADDYVIDDEFLRYFRFICDIIHYKNWDLENKNKKDGDKAYENKDIFDLLKDYFNTQNGKFDENIKMLEDYFDCWCNIRKDSNSTDVFANPTEFIKSFMSTTHESGKIKTFLNAEETDVFERCIHTYADRNGSKRQFHLRRVIMLYAIVVYLMNQTRINRDEFIRRIRIVNNLIHNSESEITDSRMQYILQAVDYIIKEDNLNGCTVPNFNANQIKEELAKIEFLSQYPMFSEKIHLLEDHNLLKGQISIVWPEGEEDFNLFELLNDFKIECRLAALFNYCDKDKIDCALMTIDDYGQQERNKRNYQYGSRAVVSAWENLFHKSGNGNFDKTRKALVNLLKNNQTLTDAVLDRIINDYLRNCESKKEYPFNYYYVKYKAFRPGSYGILRNENKKDNPYLFTVLKTQSQLSESSYIPYFKEVENSEEVLKKDYYGQRLVYGDKYIKCENNRYVVKWVKDDNEVDDIPIPQNGNGIDAKDRVILLRDNLQTKGLKSK